jgi:hypothetical protein
VQGEASAKALQDIYDWFAGLPDYRAELVKAETAAWRFRVYCGERSTEILLPFKPSDKVYRDTYKSLKLYFDIFGGK